MASKKQLLDPIGTVCRLISLNFEPDKTKISISNHAIEIQLPDKQQWFQRWMKGDDRDNISDFYHVIVRVIEWYVIPLHDIVINKKPIIKSEKNVELDQNENKMDNNDEIENQNQINPKIEKYLD